MVRWLRETAGDTATELALIAPTLLLVLFGIFEMGRVVDAWLIVHNASREGVRAGVVADPPNTIGAVTQQAAGNYLSGATAGRGDLAGLLVGSPIVTADAVELTTGVDVVIYTPIMRNVLAATVPVRASATMRRQ